MADSTTTKSTVLIGSDGSDGDNGDNGDNDDTLQRRFFDLLGMKTMTSCLLTMKNLAGLDGPTPWLKCSLCAHRSAAGMLSSMVSNLLAGTCQGWTFLSKSQATASTLYRCKDVSALARVIYKRNETHSWYAYLQFSNRAMTRKNYL
jgi:hypothetical protein